MQRITLENSLGIVLLENLIAVTYKSVFGIDFASISGSTTLIKGYGLSGSEGVQRFCVLVRRFAEHTWIAGQSEQKYGNLKDSRGPGHTKVPQ